MFALTCIDEFNDITIVERSSSVGYLAEVRKQQDNPSQYKVVPLSQRAFIHDFGSLLPEDYVGQQLAAESEHAHLGLDDTTLVEDDPILAKLAGLLVPDAWYHPRYLNECEEPPLESE